MLTELPTDNLYKFVTVGAIALIGASIWFGNGAFATLFERQQKLDAAIERTIETTRRMHELQRQVKALPPGVRSNFARFQLETEIANSSAEIRDLGKIEKTYSDYWPLFLIHLGVTGIFLIVSGYIFYSGFRKWKRHQLLNDTLLKIEVKKAKQELSASGSENDVSETPSALFVGNRRGSPTLRLYRLTGQP